MLEYVITNMWDKISDDIINADISTNMEIDG